MNSIGIGDLVELIDARHPDDGYSLFDSRGRCLCGCGVAIGMQGIVTSLISNGAIVRFADRTTCICFEALRKISPPPQEETAEEELHA
jgi:hypothetical protein